MKTTISKTQTKNNIAERAMLVHLSIGFWEGRVKDKDITTEVATDKRAAKDAGMWWTQVIPKAAIKPVTAARNLAREIHLRCTLPWLDDGIRILPADMFMSYTAEMRKARAAFDKAVKQFIEAYPEHVKNGRKRLGGLFDATYFPGSEELGNKFPWAMEFFPMPDANDFRVNIDAEVKEQIKADMSKQALVAMDNAMGDLWQRLHTSVSKIAERLADHKAVFRDSLIENVKDLCDLLPRMNITGNTNLEKMRQDVLTKLGNQDPEALRKNKTARGYTAKDANEILKTMKAFMGKAGGK